MAGRQAGRVYDTGDAMDHWFFDTLTLEISTGNTRRTVLGGLALGVFGWGTSQMAQETLSRGRCRDGQHKCHGNCCPRRGRVCCKHGCCKKGYKCCGDKCCRK